MSQLELVSPIEIEKRDSELIKNPIIISILLELGKIKKLTYEDIKKRLGYEEDALRVALNYLESIKFIKQNPSNDPNKKYEDRRYLLGLEGMFFLNKLKDNFPELRDSFNFFF